MLTQTLKHKSNKEYCLDDGVAVPPPPLWIGQVSIAGSAMATLQKELSTSAAAARKIIRPVKSPSPSRRVGELRETPEAIPPPFKDSTLKIHSGAELQTGVVYLGGMERVYEDWGAKVCYRVQ